MQREGGFEGRGDPFAGRSLMSSFFGGGLFRDDPFDDPFFTRPFGSLFGSEIRESANVIPPAGNRPVIRELNSDGEEEEEEENDGDNKAKELSLLTGKKSRDVVKKSDDEKMDEENQQVKSQSFCYQKVTYGGVDGIYRTSTVSRRRGSDGIVIEESKAADKTTGQAEHRISRGIQNKGHSVTRMLKPDGKVETMQTLHNLNEDELAGFEESWKGNAGKQVGQWKKDEEPKKKISSAWADSGGWDSNNKRLNWKKKTSPVISTTTSGDSGRTSSSNVGVGVKKVVRIPIE